MKSLYLFPLIPLLLVSCSKEEVALQKHFSTYSTQSGNITVKDDIIGTVEGGKTSSLAFRSAGIVSDIYILPGDTVKKGQILARLSNQESSIQTDALSKVASELENLGLTTNAIRIGTEGIGKTTTKLYDERIKQMDTSIQTLETNLAKAKQSLKNQNSSLESSFVTFANDFDRISTSMLYEGDKILGITTNFEYANDGWEPYLGARIGDSQKIAKDKWGALYALRGKIRQYTDTGSTVKDVGEALQNLTDAYNGARLYATAMNSMLQNSVVGAELSQERLDGWNAIWNNLTGGEQASEATFVTWKNGNRTLTSTENGSGSVADKDIIALELELQNLKQSKATLLAEKEAKLQEIETNVNTVKGKKGEVSLQIAQNQMNFSLARESGEYSIIRAPFDGVILEKFGEEGMVVGAGTPLVKITSNDIKTVKTYIDNSLYNYKTDGIVRADSTDNETLTGKITLLQEQKDPLHNKNYTEILLSGTGVVGTKITLHLERKKSSLQNGTLIPLSSILTRYGPPGVYLLEDGKARFQLVEILGSDMSYAEVLGVPEGATIITDGKENLYDGENISK